MQGKNGVELLERESHTEAVAGAMSAAESGRGAVVTIEGSSGMGKTSLLGAGADLAAERGFRVLHAAGDDLEQGLPWSTAVHLFGETVHDPDAAGLFSRAAGLALPLLEEARPPAPERPDAELFPLLHGLHWLTANLCAREPLLLSVDDVQLCDLQSLRFLNYLLPRIGELRCLALAALRPGERTEPPASELVERLCNPATATAVRLEPLSASAVHRLVRRRLPAAEDTFCDAIATASGGNPLFAWELAGTARDENLTGTAASADRLAALRPDGVRGTILMRLARLGEEPMRIARAVSVLGPGATPDLVRELAGLDADSATGAADALVSADILRAGDTLAFEHPVIREVVYADVPPLQLAREHLAAARRLHDCGRPAEQVAAHLEASEPVSEEWALAALRTAAKAALAKGAPDRAARHLRRALDARGDRADPELTLETALAELAAAEPAAIDHLEAAASIGDATVRAMALGGLAQARYVGGDAAGAVNAAAEALEILPAGRGGRLEAELLCNLAVAARPSAPEMSTLARVLERPRPDPDGEASAAEIARSAWMTLDATLRCRTAAAREHLPTVLSALDDPRSAARVGPGTVAATVVTLGLLDRYDTVYALIDPELDRASRLGRLVEIAQVLETRMTVNFRCGHVNRSLADAERLLSLQGEGWEVATIPTRVTRAALLLERGELELARSAIAVQVDVERRTPGTWAALWLPWGRSLLAAAAADWRESLDQALVAGERADAAEARNPNLIGWRSLAARACLRLGQSYRAAALAREDLELARASGSARATGLALATTGVVEQGTAAVATLEAAVAELDRVGAALDAARARVELGIALRRQRRVREARAPLAEALDLARRAGSLTVAEQALQGLRSTGARPRRAALSGAESLTASELRVAELAARGMANQEIAERLFVTLRTVETHLTHTYRKLGIGSRRELVGALAGDSGPEPQAVGAAAP